MKLQPFNNDWEAFAPRNARRLRRRPQELAAEEPASSAAC
jgi:hypothetical protein